MKHSDESKADLRFSIPPATTAPDDILITLVYCNQRSVAEICADRVREWAVECGVAPDYIAFYHAHVGSDKKTKFGRSTSCG